MVYGIAGRGHRRQSGRLKQLAMVAHQHPVGPHQSFRPVSRRNDIFAGLHPVPLAKVQSGPMQHIAIVGRKANHRAHGQPAKDHERHVLRCPVDVVEQYALGKTARNESGIVGVKDGREDDLLETIVVVGAQRIDFGASRLWKRSAAMEWRSV